MFGQGIHNKTFQFFHAVLLAQPVFEVVPVLPISYCARPYIAQTERYKQIVVYYVYYFVHDILSYKHDSSSSSCFANFTISFRV